MTEQEAQTIQKWEGMAGVTAFHLIERHADGWDDIGLMMDAWLKAHLEAEREACAKLCDAQGHRWESGFSTNTVCADAIRMRSNG